MDGEIVIKFWGVRGTSATPGMGTIKYGGNTSCVEVRCGERLFILDAGSGIRKLGIELAGRGAVHGVILFSHLHWDHIQGFPLFRPFYIPGNKFEIYGEKKNNGSMEQLMAGQMSYPYFPVPLEVMRAEKSFHEIVAGDVLKFGDVVIKTSPNNHPMGCLAYRFEYKGKSLVYATDTEHFSCLDPNLLKISQNTDLLIYDANYTDDEYCGKVGFPRTGWGHSTWQEGCKIAEAAGVKQLALFHHDPEHDDDFMDKVEESARERFKDTFAAREGMTIVL